MRPGTPLLQRLLPLLLISLRQLNASVERVKHTLELVKGRERLQSAREGIDMNGWDVGDVRRVWLRPRPRGDNSSKVSPTYLLVAAAAVVSTALV